VEARPERPGFYTFPRERPCPGQLWKHTSIRVIVVAASPSTIIFEDLSERAGVTRDSLSNFLEVFAGPQSPAQ
jgi:hypothetical protein